LGKNNERWLSTRNRGTGHVQKSISIGFIKQWFVKINIVIMYLFYSRISPVAGLLNTYFGLILIKRSIFRQPVITFHDHNKPGCLIWLLRTRESVSAVVTSSRASSSFRRPRGRHIYNTRMYCTRTYFI